MTIKIPERAGSHGVPVGGDRLRPTSAVSGGWLDPSGDGRVQRELPGLAVGGGRGAVLSADLGFRYVLTRRWGSGPRGMFVCLNPSTADAEADDASTRRMVGFGRSAGWGSLALVNLYAWRSTSPAELRRVPDPVGPENDMWIRRAAAGAEVVVAAWGSHAVDARAAAVLRLLGCVTLWCLGRTLGGHPRHPLYVPARTPLEVFRPADHAWSEWHPVVDVGVPEAVGERFCRVCGADQVAADESGLWSR